MAASDAGAEPAGGQATVLCDLEDRMRHAAINLEQLADQARSTDEALRLVAKASGVELARSYVEEAIRDAAARSREDG